METLKVMIGGKEMELTAHEAKHIADMWWEKYGKSGMEKFFEHYRKKAAENIGKAIGRMPPESEHDVKIALSIAAFSQDPDLIAEVTFEAMEWQSAYAGLKSIED